MNVSCGVSAELPLALARGSVHGVDEGRSSVLLGFCGRRSGLTKYAPFVRVFAPRSKSSRVESRRSASRIVDRVLFHAGSAVADGCSQFDTPGARSAPAAGPLAGDRWRTPQGRAADALHHVAVRPRATPRAVGDTIVAARNGRTTPELGLAKGGLRSNRGFFQRRRRLFCLRLFRFGEDLRRGLSLAWLPAREPLPRG